MLKMLNLKCNADDTMVVSILKSMGYSLVDQVIKDGVVMVKDHIATKRDVQNFMNDMRQNSINFVKNTENASTKFTYTTEVAEQFGEIDDTIKNVLHAKKNQYTPLVSVLLAGAPGTGKTATMRYFVQKIMRHNREKTWVIVMDGAYLKQFANDTAIRILQNTMQECINKVKLGFNVAMAIDEIDCLFGVDKNNKNTRSDILVTFLFLLNEMTRICEQPETMGKFFFFGTTNHVSIMDEAFSRRFSYFLSFGTLDASLKQNIYSTYLKQYSKLSKNTYKISKKIIEFLCEKEFILSPDDIRTLIKNAFNHALLKNIPLNANDLFRSYISSLRKTMEFSAIDPVKINKTLNDLKEQFNALEKSEN